MKKLLGILLFSIFILVSCTNPKPSPNSPQSNNKKYSIEDYYPFKENILMSYKDTVNDFGDENIYVDFINKNRIQIRSVDGGTTLGRVLENKNDQLSILISREEFYYKDNLIAIAENEGEKEVILKEPLEVGTSWDLPNGNKRTITNVTSNISTPSGNYKALEVTTEGKNYTTKDYYAPNVGLIKSTFVAGDTKITKSLSKIAENTSFTQSLKLYYPKAMKNDIRIVSTKIRTSLKTNEDIKDTFQKHFQNPLIDNLASLISKNTKINDLYLNTEENKVYVDFSEEFTDEMNAGSSKELSIIRSITNSLGNYYNVDKVYISVEGEPYTSGHISLDKNESFIVDYDDVIKIQK
ncbi:hypothetical protein GOM49_14165 [Clostridium bovifaecis]|uniref:GerMN domain-containing protein n=1 Tax=Clostridium bovifaecis TaxID=2184719 RepID=A0A6I6EUP7_9CLOT|nr:hypothetical protein GOM49_14165 [Clostridium bovifaecis]